MVPECRACGQRFWYPRLFCPLCGAAEVGAVPHPGNGTVYSYTIVLKNPAPQAPAAPYIVAYVELQDGPRILTVLHADDIESVSVGAPVRLHADPNDGTGPPEFALATSP